MAKITFADKDKTASVTSAAKQWRDVDANEVKASVNALYDTIDVVPLVYAALLTQSGTDAPTSDINKNTVGDTTIIYITPGNYSLLNPLFLKGKTWTSLQTTKDSADFIIISSVDGEVTILTQDKITGDGVDEALVNTPIKIEVYP